MLEYLKSEYKRTRFPVFCVSKMKYLKVFDAAEANELFRKEKIKVSQGANSKLIVWIGDLNELKS